MLAGFDSRKKGKTKTKNKKLRARETKEVFPGRQVFGFFFWFCFVLFFVFCLFVVVAICWAAPTAYGGSQARG